MTPSLRSLSCLLPFLWSLSLQAQSVAFTFDDGAKPGGSRLSASQVNAAILGHLKAAGVASTLFFTVGDGSPERLALAKAWGEAGHGIGNHTVSQPSLNENKTSLAAYVAEVKACDAVIRTMPGYTQRFRFTYLKEGNTAEKRDGFRGFADPIYREQPQVLPAGESLLWSLAKAKGVTGLRYPAEDDVYEKPILDKLGL